jgi:pyrroline-5-carboxylate reductase
MAEALARGLLAGGVPAGSITAVDVAEARREFFKRELGVRATTDNASVLAGADVLVFAVKPQNMPELLATLKGASGGKLFISICAGISTAFIEERLGGAPRVVRAMPNTPMLVAAGAAAIAKGSHATDDDLETARAIFETAAKVIVVKESMMDAVTAVSGSGPAYYFYLTEALVEAGVKLGLPRDAALALARQTAFGAGKLLAGSEDLPETLRQKVTSPGGTTFAAISKMEEAHVKAAIVAAIGAAAARSKELGK